MFAGASTPEPLVERGFQNGSGAGEMMVFVSASGRDPHDRIELTQVTRPSAAACEVDELRGRALRLLAIGVGDHTPVEVRDQVAAIARRLAELDAGADEWA